MTHDLLCSVLGTLDGELLSVEVTRLEDNTFFALLTVRHGQTTVRIDSRPSDAIPPASRAPAPSFVAAAVLALNVPIVALWVVRSHWVLARLGYRLPLISLAAVTTVGNVAGTLTPGGAGDVLRGVALKDRHELPAHVACRRSRGTALSYQSSRSAAALSVSGDDSPRAKR